MCLTHKMRSAISLLNLLNIISSMLHKLRYFSVNPPQKIMVRPMVRVNRKVPKLIPLNLSRGAYKHQGHCPICYFQIIIIYYYLLYILFLIECHSSFNEYHVTPFSNMKLKKQII